MAKEKVFEIVIRVEREGSRLNCYEVNNGDKIEERVPYNARVWAEENKGFLGKQITANTTIWRRLEEIPSNYSGVSVSYIIDNNVVEGIELSDENIRTLVAESHKKKPKDLIIPNQSWKLAAFSLLKGDNILFLGHSGCGKTFTAEKLAEAYSRPIFKFNLGAMQDARASLIGNTHYKKDEGTYFVGSDFIKAITTPGAIVLLDEITRVSHDAENILMTVLDPNQRYLRLDESPETPTILVADGVSFFATANIGVEYTSTRLIDRATKDRFASIIEVPLLTLTQEVKLLTMLYPDVNPKYIEAIAFVACHTREDLVKENPEFETIISTRSTVKQCELAYFGFSYSEIMEALVFPMYDDTGRDSERAKMKIVAQKYQNINNESPIKFNPSPKKEGENLFNSNDVI